MFDTILRAYRWENVLTKIITSLFSHKNFRILLEIDPQLMVNLILSLYNKENKEMLDTIKGKLTLESYQEVPGHNESYSDVAD
mmetsp:Transcript_16311/g.13979  ORF Transcript_16311/g.13979 Transcript_16311/m.13979 type:complete len:83 (-) Transcript_16311:1982-2230(-)